MSMDPNNIVPFTACSAAAPLPVSADSPFSGSVMAGMIDAKSLTRDDPAVLVGLAIRLGVMGRVRREGIPPMLREKLRLHAQLGEPACAIVLDWLDRLLLTDIEAVSAGISGTHR